MNDPEEPELTGRARSVWQALSENQKAAIVPAALLVFVIALFSVGGAIGSSNSDTSTSADPYASAASPTPTASVDTSSWAYRQGQADGNAVAQSYGFRAAPDGTVTDCDPKNEASKFVTNPADKANFDAGWVMACKAAARAAVGLPVG